MITKELAGSKKEQRFLRRRMVDICYETIINRDKKLCLGAKRVNT